MRSQFYRTLSSCPRYELVSATKVKVLSGYPTLKRHLILQTESVEKDAWPGCMATFGNPTPWGKIWNVPEPIRAPENLEDLGFDNKSSMPQITLKETSSLTLLRTFVPTSLHELAMRSRDIISCKSVTHAVWKKTPSGKHVSYDSHCACFMPSCLCSEAAWHEDNGGSEHGRSWNVWRQKALCDFCQQSMQRSSATHCTAS